MSVLTRIQVSSGGLGHSLLNQRVKIADVLTRTDPLGLWVERNNILLGETRQMMMYQCDFDLGRVIAFLIHCTLGVYLGRDILCERIEVDSIACFSVQKEIDDNSPILRIDRVERTGFGDGFRVVLFHNNHSIVYANLIPLANCMM